MACFQKGSPAVKRVLTMLLIALMTLSAPGCELMTPPDEVSDAPTPDATEPPEATPQPTPTPVPTPEPTPVPVVALQDYKYQKVSNQALSVSFDYPSHWINVPGSITICYVQPVNEGEVAARVAVSVKKAGKNLNAEGLKKEMIKLAEAVSGGFANFRRSSPSKKVKLGGSNAYSVVYEAELDGKTVKGFIIATYKSSKQRLLALHFYAPSDRYNDFQPMLKQVMDSVKLN